MNSASYNRFSFSNEIDVPNPPFDWQNRDSDAETHPLKRTQALKMHRQPEEKKSRSHPQRENKGNQISMKLGILVLSVVFGFCCALLISMAIKQENLRTEKRNLQTDLTEKEETRAELQDKYDDLTSEATIVYHASQELGMIPASSAITKEVTIATNAGTSEEAAEETAEEVAEETAEEIAEAGDEDRMEYPEKASASEESLQEIYIP